MTLVLIYFQRALLLTQAKILWFIIHIKTCYVIESLSQKRERIWNKDIFTVSHFLFHTVIFSPAAIGNKYPLSKVKYDISLDIFPTCTFADTAPPDAEAKILWFIIHLKMPVFLYRVQGTAWYLLDVKNCKKLFVCKSSSSLQQFRALFNFAMYMIDGEVRIRNYFNDFQHNHHDYSHKNLK